MVWTLRKKIFIGYGLTLLLMVIILAWAFVNLWQLGQAGDAILRKNYKSILAAENMVYAIERQDSAILLLFLGYEEQGWRQLRENESQFLQWLSRAKDNITEQGEDQVVRKIDEGYSSYLNHVSALRPLHGAGSGRSASFYHETILPDFLSVRDHCIRLRDINQEAMFRASDRARGIAGRAIWSMAGVGFAAIVIGVGFSLFLSNLLAQPVRQLVEATQKISEGNYDVEVTTRSADELGSLTEKFNQMARKLKAFHSLNIDEMMAEKRRSEAVIRSIDDGIILVDSEMKVTAMNPMAGKILSVDPETARNRHFLEVGKNESLFNYLRQSVESGKPPRIDEGRNVMTVEKEGGQGHYQFSVTPVHRRSGSLLGVVLLLRDVTRLTELDRMKSEFVMTASHELRTPLTGIGMSIDLLIEKAAPKLGDRERELLDAAHEDVQRLKALVSNLLDLSRIEAGRMEMEFSSVSIPVLFESVAAFFRKQAEEKEIDIALTAREGIPPARADADKINWVLTNLISNALRYTDRKGHIRLLADNLGAYVHVSVQDDGAGIPYEYQSKIFDKFVQVRSGKALGASGLGLTICREIIHAHGGTIWVESAPGEGSTFTFTLPVAGLKAMKEGIS